MIETTADRLRLARERFPELRSFLHDGLIAQLDSGTLDGVIAGALRLNAPPIIAEVLRFITVASEDENRRRTRAPAPASGRVKSPGPTLSGSAATEPEAISLVPSKPKQPASSAGRASQPPLVRPPVTSLGAASAAADSDAPAKEELSQPEPAAEQAPPILIASSGPGLLDPSMFSSQVDAFDETDGELEAIETERGVSLSWTSRPAAGGEHILYLLVASGDGVPGSILAGERVAATSATHVELPPDSGPYFSLFAFIGPSAEEAMAGKGRPHGSTVLLPEVRELAAEPFPGSVILRWQLPAKIERVRVMRSAANEVLPRRFDPALELVLEHHEAVRDNSVVAGARYQYRVVTVGHDDRLSAGRVVTAVVPMRLAPVTTLKATISTDPHGQPWVNLHYVDPEAGKVTIFASPEVPEEVPVGRVFDEGSLMELGEPIQLRPTTEVDGSRSILDVPFDLSEHTRWIFTPVSSGGGKFVVGRTAAVDYVGPIEDAEIIDRVRYQILRFDWPRGADSVGYLIGPPGSTAEMVSGRPHSIDRPTYDQVGGVVIPSLDDRGARVHVRGASRFGMIVSMGEPAVVDYPGRLVLEYRFAPESGSKWVLQVRTERAISDPMYAEVLANQYQWIPSDALSHAQRPPGTVSVAQIRRKMPIQAATWTSISDPFHLPSGYIRTLFHVDGHRTPLVVIDPLPGQPGGSHSGGNDPSTGMLRGISAFREAVGSRSAPPPEPVVQRPRHVTCPVCLEAYPDATEALRCPPEGSCVPVRDAERARFLREEATPDRPVHVGPAIQHDGPNILCPKCKTPGAQPVCPHCHSALPRHWETKNALTFAFIGAKTTGKTVCMTVLQRELADRVAPSIGRTLSPMNEDTKVRATAYRRELYTDRRMTGGTIEVAQNPELLNPLLYSLDGLSSGGPTAIGLFDVAGEDMRTVAKVERYGHILSRSDCLVFLFDVLQLVQVKNHLQGIGEGYFAFPPMSADPTEVLHNVVSVIRQHQNLPHGPLPNRFAIVLSKIDGLQKGSRAGIPEISRMLPPGSVLMQDPYLHRNGPLYVPGDAELVHREVGVLLERLGAHDFVNAVTTNLGNFRYFALSALGHGPIGQKTLSDAGVNSFRVCDAIRWTMSEKTW